MVAFFILSSKFIQTVSKRNLNCGKFNYQIDLQELNSGVYSVIIASKDYNESIRMSKL